MTCGKSIMKKNYDGFSLVKKNNFHSENVEMENGKVEINNEDYHENLQTIIISSFPENEKNLTMLQTWKVEQVGARTMSRIL
ncbi:hypothetical protein Phum_PHUM026740 [Pediculus humanus corporis]|uniref:Uncharacterized protein n=1 Tax=Pediculus humanus subsp. corporis TaxID=121224 RepID=E0VA43_PEDHC|nr:uncharacterized protein Phum_PHUM026740 [Pediculus humanus corporis]EEB10249.1 hypothetical protein Phum_PHUM026740 [Pediculus humanus corporis]